MGLPQTVQDKLSSASVRYQFFVVGLFGLISGQNLLFLKGFTAWGNLVNRLLLK